MIEAIIKSSSNIINKPFIKKIIIENENDIAIRRKDDETGRIEQFTIGELFDSFNKKASYNVNTPDSLLFEEWFSNKFIKGRNIENSIIGVQYHRI